MWTRAAVIFAWLLFLNARHLGVNASLHWDAESSITYGPVVGTRQELVEARAHLFDCLTETRSDDPAAVTRFYWSEPGLQYHGPLTACRHYYTFVSDWIGHAAFELGRAVFHRPAAAVWVYQLTAIAATAFGFAMLIERVNLTAILLVLAVSASPVFLSISRQWLTETAGFVFFCGAVAAMRQWGSRPVFAAAALGICSFLAIRSRYTLAPAVVAAILGLMPRQSGRPLRTAAKQIVVLFAVAGGLVILDLRRFGPLISPAVYDAVMVRSNRLFFHADMPYDRFVVSLWENLTLLVLPTAIVWAWVIGRSTDRRERWGKAVAVVGLIGTFILLWRTAAQQVQYQGRHLLPITLIPFVLATVAARKVSWQPVGRVTLVGSAVFFIVWHVYGSYGAQRQRETAGLPDVLAVLDRHRDGRYADNPRSLFSDLWWTDFVWSDARLLHDSLTVWNQVVGKNAVVLLDDTADRANQFDFYAHEFPAFTTVRFHDLSQVRLVAADAIARGRPVYLITVPGHRPAASTMTTQRVDCGLTVTLLCRVTRVPE